MIFGHSTMSDGGLENIFKCLKTIFGLLKMIFKYPKIISKHSKIPDWPLKTIFLTSKLIFEVRKMIFQVIPRTEPGSFTTNQARSGGAWQNRMVPCPDSSLKMRQITGKSRRADFQGDGGRFSFSVGSFPDHRGNGPDHSDKLPNRCGNLKNLKTSNNEGKH
jgi:hypothetical protein